MTKQTKGKHTTGPWKVGRVPLRLEQDNKPIPLIYTHDGALEIAQVRTSAPDDGEREANAHLIAAAPELLEACRAASVALQNNRQDLWEKAVKLTADAIAKAESKA